MQGTKPAPTPPPTFILNIHKRDGNCGRTPYVFDIERDWAVIGGHKECDIQVLIEGMSNFCALVKYVNGLAEIMALNSDVEVTIPRTHAVLRAKQTHKLLHGDEFFVGEKLFSVCISQQNTNVAGPTGDIAGKDGLRSPKYVLASSTAPDSARRRRPTRTSLLVTADETAHISAAASQVLPRKRHSLSADAITAHFKRTIPDSEELAPSPTAPQRTSIGSMTITLDYDSGPKTSSDVHTATASTVPQRASIGSLSFNLDYDSGPNTSSVTDTATTSNENETGTQTRNKEEALSAEEGVDISVGEKIDDIPAESECSGISSVPQEALTGSQQISHAPTQGNANGTQLHSLGHARPAAVSRVATSDLPPVGKYSRLSRGLSATPLKRGNTASQASTVLRGNMSGPVRQVGGPARQPGVRSSPYQNVTPTSRAGSSIRPRAGRALNVTKVFLPAPRRTGGIAKTSPAVSSGSAPAGSTGRQAPPNGGLTRTPNNPNKQSHVSLKHPAPSPRRREVIFASTELEQGPHYSPARHRSRLPRFTPRRSPAGASLLKNGVQPRPSPAAECFGPQRTSNMVQGSPPNARLASLGNFYFRPEQKSVSQGPFQHSRDEDSEKDCGPGSQCEEDLNEETEQMASERNATPAVVKPRSGVSGLIRRLSGNFSEPKSGVPDSVENDVSETAGDSEELSSQVDSESDEYDSDEVEDDTSSDIAETASPVHKQSVKSTTGAGFLKRLSSTFLRSKPVSASSTSSGTCGDSAGSVSDSSGYMSTDGLSTVEDGSTGSANCESENETGNRALDNETGDALASNEIQVHISDEAALSESVQTSSDDGGETEADKIPETKPDSRRSSGIGVQLWRRLSLLGSSHDEGEDICSSQRGTGESEGTRNPLDNCEATGAALLGKEGGQGATDSHSPSAGTDNGGDAGSDRPDSYSRRSSIRDVILSAAEVVQKNFLPSYYRSLNGLDSNSDSGIDSQSASGTDEGTEVEHVTSSQNEVQACTTQEEIAAGNMSGPKLQDNVQGESSCDGERRSAEHDAQNLPSRLQDHCENNEQSDKPSAPDEFTPTLSQSKHVENTTEKSERKNRKKTSRKSVSRASESEDLTSSGALSQSAEQGVQRAFELNPSAVTVAELKSCLKTLGEKTGGLKAELLARMAAALLACTEVDDLLAFSDTKVRICLRAISQSSTGGSSTMIRECLLSCIRGEQMANVIEDEKDAVEDEAEAPTEPVSHDAGSVAGTENQSSSSLDEMHELYEKSTVAVLRKYCVKHKVELPKRVRKGEIIDLLIKNSIDHSGEKVTGSSSKTRARARARRSTQAGHIALIEDKAPRLGVRTPLKEIPDPSLNGNVRRRSAKLPSRDRNEIASPAAKSVRTRRTRSAKKAPSASATVSDTKEPTKRVTRARKRTERC